MLFNNKMSNLATICQYVIMDHGNRHEKQPEAIAVNLKENTQDNEKAVGMKSRIHCKGYQSS